MQLIWTALRLFVSLKLDLFSCSTGQVLARFQHSETRLGTRHLYWRPTYPINNRSVVQEE